MASGIKILTKNGQKRFLHKQPFLMRYFTSHLQFFILNGPSIIFISNTLAQFCLTCRFIRYQSAKIIFWLCFQNKISPSPFLLLIVSWPFPQTYMPCISFILYSLWWRKTIPLIWTTLSSIEK